VSFTSRGRTSQVVTSYLIRGIESVHGGPESISPTSGATRHNYMSGHQAKAFLGACRAHMSFPITRLGHSAELGFARAEEFADEKCFHLEVAQPFDGVWTLPETMIA
jgi:hypothetical protein